MKSPGLKSLRLFIGLALASCYSPLKYEELQTSRWNELRQEPEYWNSIVVFDKVTGYGSDFPLWSYKEAYYVGDVVRDEQGDFFEAIKDSKNVKPSFTSQAWEHMPITHPYFFLRDSASQGALEGLLEDDAPIVRTYAFAALDYRGAKNLDRILEENLRDTSRFMQMTGDVGCFVSPADLMILYRLNEMSRDEKLKLLELIQQKYTHLKKAKKLLSDNIADNTVSF